MKGKVAVLVAALCPLVLSAQTPGPAANPVSDTVRDLLARHSKNLVASAELMPADKYGYHPTPAQMTFGQLIVHIVQTNEFLCSAIGGTVRMPPEKPVETDSKDVLVAAIKTSFEHCTDVLTKVNDAQLGDAIAMGPQKLVRANLMITIATDWADHYSTAASYLRLNGILPPTAQPRR